jgi:ethanolamine utilization protein EutJ
LAALANQPHAWRLEGVAIEDLVLGVDLGTAALKVVILDSAGRPLAARLMPGEVVRDGVIFDYAGAVLALRGLLRSLRPDLVDSGALAATAFPPGTGDSVASAARHVLEACGLRIQEVVEEPVAAARALALDSGAIADIGGGTTGIAVLQDGKVVYAGDEATGGLHLTLVLSGRHNISFEAAEELKRRGGAEVLRVVEPVLEKIADIISRQLADFPRAPLLLVGGTAALEGAAEIIAAASGRQVSVSPQPQWPTPLGTALAAL